MDSLTTPALASKHSGNTSRLLLGVMGVLGDVCALGVVDMTGGPFSTRLPLLHVTAFQMPVEV